MAARVVILAQDLIWADRLARAATDASATSTRVSSLAALTSALASAGPTHVIVDMTARAYEPMAAIAAASAAGAHVLAVGQHDDVGARKRALAAGAERVLAYRKLFEDGPATIGAWLAGALTTPSGRSA